MDPKELKQVLEGIKGHINDTTKEIKELLDKQDNEIKQYGESTEKTGRAIDDATKRIDKLQEELKAAQSRMDEMEKKGGRLFGGQADERKSLGQRFVESDAFKGFDPNSQDRSGAVNVKSFYSGRKTLTGEALGDTPGYLYDVNRVPGIIAPPERVERVRDLIPVLSTTQGAIEFVRETGFTNNASTVPEFRDTDEIEKPKSAISFEIQSISMKTIAHWLPVTRQILADATGLQSYIDSRLIYGLKMVEDAQILYGDGTGSNLQGIMTADNVQEYKWSDGKAGDNKIDAIRRAMTKARLAEYPVTGIVMHPNDWEDIELLKGSDGHYIWVRVTEGGQQRLWRVPVVDTTAINEGDFLTGAFMMGTALWDREQASIRVSDSHQDFFTKNLLAILAEERITQTIYRPEAFVVGTFDAAPEEPAE